MANLEQWVNLTKDSKWVEGDITSEERVGHVNVKCELKNATPAAFKVRLYPESEIEYSKEEKTRNHNFMIRPQMVLATNMGQKTVKLDEAIYLPAAGGNKYRLEAKYKDTVLKSSKSVEARRKVFFQEIAMAGVGGVPLGGLQSELWSPDKQYYIKMVQEGGAETIPLLKYIRNDADRGELLKQVKKVYKLRAYDPHAFALLWVNSIARADAHEFIETVDLQVSSKFWDPQKSDAIALRLPAGAYLWHGFNPLEDANKAWILKLECIFIDAKGTKTNLKILRDDVSITDKAAFTDGGHREFQIDMKDHRKSFPTNKGKVWIRMSVQIAKWSNGFSFSGVNVLAIAEKVFWGRVRTPDQRQGTVNHEVGHTLGMVANGDRKKGSPFYNERTPDAPTGFYVGNGHVGRHCSEGVKYDGVAKAWVGTPKCVMFGESHSQRPKEFCNSCAPTVRKLDLGPGLASFRSILDRK